MLITPNIALVVFAIILVISAVVAWQMHDYASYDKCGFHTFIAILAGLGVFVTFMFYYNIVALQAQQQKYASIEAISNLNSTLLNSMLEEMKEASMVIPNFVLSITPLTNTVCDSSAPPDLVNPETCTAKLTLSYRIFSLWQDTIITDTVVNAAPSAYVTNFLQRANSSQLFQQWTVNRLNFNPRTQTFGDLLFEYGLPITEQTTEAYVTTAEQLIADPRFQELLKD